MEASVECSPECLEAMSTQGPLCTLAQIKNILVC